MDMSYTDLKIYPLQPTKMYSFVYNNQDYSGEFIGKKNKSFQTEFLFKEFVFYIHHIQPFNVLFFKEYSNSVRADECFTDSDSEYESNTECEQDMNEYDIIENEEAEYIFC